MTEEVVDVDALEVVRIGLSEDNHRPTGSHQSIDELRTEAVVVAGGRRASDRPTGQSTPRGGRH